MDSQFNTKSLHLPLQHHIYSIENANMFRNAVLYSFTLMTWDKDKYPDFCDEESVSIMDYIDNHQFHWLLALGHLGDIPPTQKRYSSPNDNTIEYCRKEAEKFSVELDKYESYMSEMEEDDLPF